MAALQPLMPRRRPQRHVSRIAVLVTAPIALIVSTASLAGIASAAAGPESKPAMPVADLAEMHPVDPAGHGISLHQTRSQAAKTMNCTLTVPASPLTAQGLATPWQLGDGCRESNPNLQAYVEATILAPGGHVSVYDPLVVTQGRSPAVAPKPPQIPAGSQVIIDTGFNGSNLVLEGAGARQGKCIDAFGNSVISQTAACNALAFYQDANHQIAAGMLKVPALGQGSDKMPCPTTRSFTLIDQDQSDNVLAGYLLTRRGQTAQETAANKAALHGAKTITNGSDDALLGHFVDPALGCKPFTAHNPTSPTGTDGSQALNELSARQNQKSPIALLPVNDPQLLVNGHFSIGKTNAYRALTDQPALSSTTSATKNAQAYCLAMVNTAPARLQLDKSVELGFTTPVPALGNNLGTFMGARLSGSFGNLFCQAYALRNPVRLRLNQGGVATGVRYNAKQQHPGR